MGEEGRAHLNCFPELFVVAAFEVFGDLARIAHRLGLGLQKQLSNGSISTGRERS